MVCGRFFSRARQLFCIARRNAHVQSANDCGRSADLSISVLEVLDDSWYFSPPIVAGCDCLLFCIWVDFTYILEQYYCPQVPVGKEAFSFPAAFVIK